MKWYFDFETTRYVAVIATSIIQKNLYITLRSLYYASNNINTIIWSFLLGLY